MHHSRLCDMLRYSRRSSLVILCYHRVLPAAKRAQYSFPDLAVTPEVFRQQVAFCSQHYNCMNLGQAMQRMQSSKSFDKPTLVFTFDDGYADNFQYVAPILDEFSASGTFFIISSLNDTPMTAWYDRLARSVQSILCDLPNLSSRLGNKNEADRWLTQQLHSKSNATAASVVRAAKKLGIQQRLAVVERAAKIAGLQQILPNDPDKMMTQAEIRELVANGHEIGAHTRTHPILTQLEDDELVAELEGGRSDLSEAADCGVESLAYPNGDFDQRVVEATRRAGYRYAVTTESGLNKSNADPLTLRRIYVSQDRLADAQGNFSRNLFQLELSGSADTLYLRNLRRGANA